MVPRARTCMCDTTCVKIVKGLQKIRRDPLYRFHLERSGLLSLDVLQQTHSQRVINKAMMIPVEGFNCEGIPRPSHTIPAIMRRPRFSEVLQDLRLPIVDCFADTDFQSFIRIVPILIMKESSKVLFLFIPVILTEPNGCISSKSQFHSNRIPIMDCLAYANWIILQCLIMTYCLLFDPLSTSYVWKWHCMNSLSCQTTRGNSHNIHCTMTVFNLQYGRIERLITNGVWCDLIPEAWPVRLHRAFSTNAG